jgi:hypothetical protein
MRQLVEFGLNDSGIIVVEVHETASVNGPVTQDLIPYIGQEERRRGCGNRTSPVW